MNTKLLLRKKAPPVVPSVRKWVIDFPQLLLYSVYYLLLEL